LAPPTPSPALKGVFLLPPLWVQEGRHTRIWERVGGPNFDEGTDTLYTLIPLWS
jgi:hypothetical protein